jgi:hypothetical protein
MMRKRRLIRNGVLPAPPFPSAADAILALSKKLSGKDKHGATPGTALHDDASGIVLQLIEFMDLFRSLFPAVASEFPRVPVGLEQSVMGCFLRLIGSRYFPIRDFVMFEAEIAMELESLLYQIPIPTLNYDYFDMMPDEMPDLLRLILARLNCITDEQFAMPLDRDSEPDLNHKKLKNLAARENPPLRYLPDAVAYALHDTGHAWLDMTEYDIGYSCLEWSRENVEMLAGEFKRAKPILQRVNSLVSWVDRNKIRLDQVAAVLDQAITVRKRASRN